MKKNSTRWQSLRDILASGKATRDQALEFYRLNQEAGNELAPDMEELILAACLQAEPGREDLLLRYRHVRKAQGKPCPAEIEHRLRNLDLQSERARDHQEDAVQYEQQSGLQDMGEEFLSLYEECRRFSMTSKERMFALFQATQYIVRAQIPGALAECGVWRGGSMMLAAKTLLNAGVSDRDLYLFDTFEGLPKPDPEKDIDMWGNKAIDGWLPRSEGEKGSSWAFASLEEVEENLAATGYPPERIHLVKGMVEETIPQHAPHELALLRLDTDWYASTKHELEHLFPLLRAGGVLIIDDYGHFRGAREATDEYLAANDVRGLLCRIDYSGRLMVRPSMPSTL